MCFEKEIFKFIYNHQHHDEFHHIYNCIAVSLFLYHLIKHLKMYILHCSECQLNQMKQHTFYELLQSIITSSILFYIIIMNFVLILLISLSLYEYNNLFTVTDKFIKWVLLLFSKFIYITANWVNVLLSDLIKHNWRILHQIISDWDQKFLSSFWHVIFEHLNTKLLISTTYYSQINSQSE